MVFEGVAHFIFITLEYFISFICDTLRKKVFAKPWQLWKSTFDIDTLVRHGNYFFYLYANYCRTYTTMFVLIIIYDKIIASIVRKNSLALAALYAILIFQSLYSIHLNDGCVMIS